MKKRIFAALLAAGLLLLTACDNSEDGGVGAQGADGGAAQQTTDSEPLPEVGDYVADIEIVDYGTVTVYLDGAAAPYTVQNFVKLAEEGFYDGLRFHRIIEGFMMQGGDPNGDGTGGSGQNIKGEFASNGVDNPLQHVRGAISMARSQANNSASSQFFIVHEDSHFLDGEYAVFGYVLDGMDVVDVICGVVPVSDQNGSVPAEYQPVIAAVRVRPASEVDLTQYEEEDPPEVSNYTVEIEVQDYGIITVELDGSAAPYTVQNFVKLAGEGFYDGLTFHRIIDGFMVQGGDPNGNGTGGSDENVKGEFASNGVNNPLQHTRGAISMARSQAKNSASSQFFIVHQDAEHLNGEYACFGYVTSGMEIVDALCEKVPVQDGNGTVAAADQPVITAVRVLDGEGAADAVDHIEDEE